MLAWGERPLEPPGRRSAGRVPPAGAGLRHRRRRGAATSWPQPGPRTPAVTVWPGRRAWRAGVPHV